MKDIAVKRVLYKAALTVCFMPAVFSMEKDLVHSISYQEGQKVGQNLMNALIEVLQSENTATLEKTLAKFNTESMQYALKISAGVPPRDYFVGVLAVVCRKQNFIVALERCKLPTAVKEYIRISQQLFVEQAEILMRFTNQELSNQLAAFATKSAEIAAPAWQQLLEAVRAMKSKISQAEGGQSSSAQLQFFDEQFAAARETSLFKSFEAGAQHGEKLVNHLIAILQATYRENIEEAVEGLFHTASEEVDKKVLPMLLSATGQEDVRYYCLGLVQGYKKPEFFEALESSQLPSKSIDFIRFLHQSMSKKAQIVGNSTNSEESSKQFFGQILKDSQTMVRGQKEFDDATRMMERAPTRSYKEGAVVGNTMVKQFFRVLDTQGQEDQNQVDSDLKEIADLFVAHLSDQMNSSESRFSDAQNFMEGVASSYKELQTSFLKKMAQSFLSPSVLHQIKVVYRSLFGQAQAFAESRNLEEARIRIAFERSRQSKL
jgi:hypothetical protein